MHYERKRKGRPVGGPEPQRRLSGQGHLTRHGYLIITVGGKNILEHRFLMEQMLGRPMERHETVHHINGARADNRTDGPLRDFRSGNLELWSRWQPAGQAVADKVQYAVEILQKYLPEALVAQLPMYLGLPTTVTEEAAGNGGIQEAQGPTKRQSPPS
jgi:hypothetical protein